MPRFYRKPARFRDMKRRVRSSALLLGALLAMAPGRANASEENPTADPEAAAQNPAEPEARSHPFVVGAVSGVLAAGVITSGALAWWRDAGYAGWSWRDTGFFERNTYAGGSDKAGHFYSWYVGVRALTGIYQSLGVSRATSLKVATGFSLLLSSTVELVDGFTKYGFEWPDVVANVTGIGLGLVQELVPSVDALVGVRLGYVPTARFIHGNFNYFKLINDYSGMIFFVDFKPAGLESVTGISPGLARYLTLSLTYSTFGYAPKDTLKRRNLGFCVGLNVPEALTALLGTNAPTLGIASTLTKYYAVPFTSVSYNRDLNNDTSAVNFGIANRWQM